MNIKNLYEFSKILIWVGFHKSRSGRVPFLGFESGSGIKKVGIFPQVSGFLVQKYLKSRVRFGYHFSDSIRVSKKSGFSLRFRVSLHQKFNFPVEFFPQKKFPLPTVVCRNSGHCRCHLSNRFH